MALWQYTFQVLNLDLNELGILSDNKILCPKNDEFNSEFFWSKYPLKRSFFNGINSILKKSKSWSNEIDLYGIQDSNCFEVYFDSNENVEYVSFRINYLSDYHIILNQIIDFCDCNKLIILDEDLNIIPLEYECVKKIIEESSQKKTYNRLI